MSSSHVSARYAAQQMAAARARDAMPRKDCPCRRCREVVPAKAMDSLCASCRRGFKAVAGRDGLDAAEAWVNAGVSP